MYRIGAIHIEDLKNVPSLFETLCVRNLCKEMTQLRCVKEQTQKSLSGHLK